MKTPCRNATYALALCVAQTAGAQELGDSARGETLFRQCKACHQVGPGASDRVGPHLNNLFGRRAGSHEGFPYSRDMIRAAAAGLEWHADTLHIYLENPKNLVSGTRMSFDGLSDARDRTDLLAYLRRFSADPSNIPEADPTATATDHTVAPEILAIVGDPDYGEYLSTECTTCHRADGGDSGIPSITLWPEEDFVIAMHAYKNEYRAHPVMQMIAGRLSDEEIAALAAYFGSLDQ